MTENSFITQTQVPNWKTGLKKFYLFLSCDSSIFIISILFFCTSACSHRNTQWKVNTAWEKLVAREIAQSGSINQVANSVIAFMKKHNVPGLSIAIAKDDQLIHVKG